MAGYSNINIKQRKGDEQAQGYLQNAWLCYTIFMDAKLISLLLHIPLKDWFILLTLSILMFSLLEIRKLKKIISQEAQKRLIPQLALELILDANPKKSGFYLKNDGFFLAREIKIEDLDLILDDYGFKLNYILKFEMIDSLKPQERIKLDFKTFDKKLTPLPEVTEMLIPHLINPAFKVIIFYTNIENIKFRLAFSKKREKFSVESLEICK
ncbi:MAG: hypothetical protein WDL87_03365 [Candidatus Omnitrophota bacterium]|jgi:hypothetical protein